MKAAAKEKLYLLIIAFCVVMCGAMITTMIRGMSAENIEEHVPVVRTIMNDNENDTTKETDKTGDASDGKSTDTEQKSGEGKPVLKDPGTTEEHSGITASEGQIAITEEYVNKQLGIFMPAAFPVKNINVSIQANGIVTMTGNGSRDELKNYLKQSNIEVSPKYAVAILLLPKEYDATVSFKVQKIDDNSIKAEIYSAELSGKNIPRSVFPDKITETLSAAINNMITEIDNTLILSGFEDGAIIFRNV